MSGFFHEAVCVLHPSGGDLKHDEAGLAVGPGFHNFIGASYFLEVS